MADPIKAAGDGKSRKGFASMSPEKLREISRKGGLSQRPEQRTFSRLRDVASKAGRKGGSSVPAEKRALVKDRELASELGRRGARARWKKPVAAE